MFYLQGRGEPLREELDGIIRDNCFKLCFPRGALGDQPVNVLPLMSLDTF